MGGIPEIVLSTGMRMPVLGMGTATYPLPPSDTVETAAYDAIELGYRHFDSASRYQSERPLGRAISRAIENGLIRSRDELFITSKLWCSDAHPAGVLPAIRETLRALGLEYVDLYLIHFPARLKGGEKKYAVVAEDLVLFDMRGTWEAMEECHGLGLAKAIGVSNFTCNKIRHLLTHANIVPAVNQVEMHPLWHQMNLRELCKEKGIHVSAFSPLGGKGAAWGSNAVLENEDIKRIAQSAGKSTAQVCLRWAFEQGVSFVAKSFNKSRLKENMEIFDWQLGEEDMEILKHLPQERLVLGQAYVSPNGMYTSLAALWDGEI